MAIRVQPKDRAPMRQLGPVWNRGMAFEGCLCLILGARIGYHSAGCHDHPVLARRLLLKALKKLRERVDNIVTMDEDLRPVILARFRELETVQRGVDWARTSITLLEVTARLLGYADRDGKIHRQVVFFRTREQELSDYCRGTPNQEGRERLLRERHALVLQLKQKGFSIVEIAQILGTSEYAVQQVLRNDLLGRVIARRADGMRTEAEIAGRLRRDPSEVHESLSRLRSLSATKKKARLSEI